MLAIEALRGDPEPANPSSLPFRDARSAAGSSRSSNMSVLDDSDDQSWHSVFDSTAWGSHGGAEIEGVPDAEMGRFVSGSSSEVDLESGDLEVKVHLGKIERDCRICHLGIDSGGGGGGRDSDTPIQLGCCCRGDLGTAHKQCAETWFKIKGNTICEICGETAQNVASQQINEPNHAVATAAAAAIASSAPAAPLTLVEARTIFHGRRIMNFLLACMLLAFAMSWLFSLQVNVIDLLEDHHLLEEKKVNAE